MAKYTVHVKIKHDHLGSGPSDLVITMRGDKKILQDVENYALHYEEMSKSLATVEAVSRNRLETILLLHDCYLDACSEADSILSDLGKLEAERDELRRRCESYKSAYDAILADLRIMEQKLNDLQVENSRLIRIGEERHIRAKDTEEGLMEHVERQKVENERLRKIITEEINLLHDEGEHVWADCLEDDLYNLEVNGGKD